MVASFDVWLHHATNQRYKASRIRSLDQCSCCDTEVFYNGTVRKCFYLKDAHTFAHFEAWRLHFTLGAALHNPIIYIMYQLVCTNVLKSPSVTVLALLSHDHTVCQETWTCRPMRSYTIKLYFSKGTVTEWLLWRSNGSGVGCFANIISRKLRNFSLCLTE